MVKKKVCCSFDYEHDRIYYNLLEAWNENDDIDFSINDCTPSEIQSESVSKIKQVLSTKIGQANYMIAIVGKHSMINIRIVKKSVIEIGKHMKLQKIMKKEMG